MKRSSFERGHCATDYYCNLDEMADEIVRWQRYEEHQRRVVANMEQRLKPGKRAEKSGG